MTDRQAETYVDCAIGAASKAFGVEEGSLRGPSRRRKMMGTRASWAVIHLVMRSEPYKGGPDREFEKLQKRLRECLMKNLFCGISTTYRGEVMYNRAYDNSLAFRTAADLAKRDYAGRLRQAGIRVTENQF